MVSVKNGGCYRSLLIFDTRKGKQRQDEPVGQLFNKKHRDKVNILKTLTQLKPCAFFIFVVVAKICRSVLVIPSRLSTVLPVVLTKITVPVGRARCISV